jgi:hypothetical protein
MNEVLPVIFKKKFKTQHKTTASRRARTTSPGHTCQRPSGHPGVNGTRRTPTRAARFCCRPLPLQKAASLSIPASALLGPGPGARLRPRGNRIAGSHVRLGEQLEKPGSVSGQSSAPLGLRECDGGRVQEGGGVADRARDPQAAAQPQTRQLQRIREAFSQFFHHAFCVTRDGARRFYSPSGVLSRSVCGCDPGAAVRVHELLDLRLHLLQRHPEGAAFPAPVFGFPPCVVTRQHLLSVPDVVCGIGKPHIPNASK